MPREIPIGNGDLLVTFDNAYRVRDIYYPYVGKFNHTAGHVQRFGVWCDGKFAWIEDESWSRSLRYRPGTLATDVLLVNRELGLELRCEDVVDFHEPAWLRRIVVRDLLNSPTPRDVRVFLHFDLSIQENPVGDTANFDPATSSLVVYKSDYYFLINACDSTRCGIEHWSIGTKRINNAEGTWRDAEDGQLGRNAIAQGSVDATVGFHLTIEPGGTSGVTFWFIAGRSYADLTRVNDLIRTRTPEKFVSRTEAYWTLWASKENIDASPLPARVRELFVRSQLVMRTQVDNRGAIIAANDTDITHFAGDHYSYCWPRDGALVAHALALAGQSELSRQFYRYAARCITRHGYFLHKYTPDALLASSWHPWTVDNQRVLPIQQDETALVVWALRKHFEIFRDVEFIKPLYTPLIVNAAKWMAEFREKDPIGAPQGPASMGGLPKPSWDLWEERRGVHTFTVAATIAGLRAAAAFAVDFGDVKRAAYWLKAAQEIGEGLRRHLWNPERQCFARMARPVYDNAGSVQRYELDMTRDSANYALFALGALEADDPMVVSDMRTVRERLWVKTSVGGCARYENDYYHQVERSDTQRVPGNPWLICTLWQAQYIIARATSVDELREAVTLLEWAADRASESGVLAEQFDPHTGSPISVSPLTWSHATVIIVVCEYLAKHRLLTGSHLDLGLIPGTA
jgi:glucoamylase